LIGRVTITVLLRAEDEPARTRVDYWQHVVGTSLAAYQLRGSGETLRGEIRQARVGALTVLDFQMADTHAVRAPDLIRKSGPRLVKVDLGIRGQGRYEQEGRQNLLAPGEFQLLDLSRPSHVDVDESQKLSIAIFPRALLPVRDNDLRDLTAVRFGPDDAYASLVASMGRELARNLGAYDGASSARIGSAFLDLLALAVATRLGRVDSVPAESRQQAMMARIEAFAEQHLANPALSPGMIAAAHHISVRTLHKMYEAEDWTVAAWIRHLRLERCRQDLLDPDLAGRPVAAVGARWGFSDAAVFSRAFRTAYGLPPAEFRTIHGSPPAEASGYLR